MTGIGGWESTGLVNYKFGNLFILSGVSFFNMERIDHWMQTDDDDDDRNEERKIYR